MSSSTASVSYRAVLRSPLIGRTFAAALVGRLSYGIVFLSLVLAITSTAGSYALAGGAIALFGLTSSLLSPVRARLIDRHGIERVLTPMAISYALLLAIIATATWRPGTPNWLLWTLAGVTGALTPPLGPVMRALWSDLLSEQELLQRAYALDTVAEELLYVTGPLIAGLLANLANPALGVAASSGLILTGSLALVSSPAVRIKVAISTEDPSRPGHRTETSAGSRQGMLSMVVSLRQPILAAAGVGVCLGASNLLVVAFAEDRGRLAAVAWVEATLAAGSAFGGLVYGAVSWRVSAQRRLPALGAALALTLVAAGLAPNIVVLAVLAGAVGLFVSPILTTVYVLADEFAPMNSRTQAGAWANTAFNAGNATGSATIGLLLGHLSLAVCFAVAALPAALGTVLGIGRTSRLETKTTASPSTTSGTTVSAAD